MSEPLGSVGFQCPECGSPTNVIDSRPNANGIRRRRECTKCGARFTTHEVALPNDAKARKDFLRKLHRRSGR